MKKDITSNPSNKYLQALRRLLKGNSADTDSTSESGIDVITRSYIELLPQFRRYQDQLRDMFTIAVFDDSIEYGIFHENQVDFLREFYEKEGASSLRIYEGAGPELILMTQTFGIGTMTREYKTDNGHELFSSIIPMEEGTIDATVKEFENQILLYNNFRQYVLKGLGAPLEEPQQ